MPMVKSKGYQQDFFKYLCIFAFITLLGKFWLMFLHSTFCSILLVLCQFMLYKNFLAIVAGGGSQKNEPLHIEGQRNWGYHCNDFATVLIPSPTVCSTFNASANYQSERASNIVSRISVSGIDILIGRSNSNSITPC